jgi:Tol biopolymer transport system component
MFRGALSVSTNGVLAHRTNSIQRRQLVWTDRTGRLLGRAGPVDENSMSSPTLTRDGQRIAVSRVVEGNADVWLLEVARGTWNRFTFDPSYDSTGQFSPDGRQIVFRSSRNGSYDLFIKSTSGTGDEQLLVATPHTKSPMSWSPDGRTLLYVTLDPANGADLWALPMTGGGKPFPVLQTRFDEMDAHFSPDGRWIAYQTNESGHFEIYVRPFPGPGGSHLVSTAGGAQPQWAHDGKEVFYVSPGNQMMAVPLTLASDGQSVKSGTPVRLFDVRLASGTSITTPGGAARGQYLVAADGRFLMNVPVDNAIPAPISIVLNWDRLLKK